MNTALGWLGDRARDAALWPSNLVRDLPPRTRRLASAAGQTGGAAARMSASSAAASSAATLAYLTDLIGAPEVFRIFWHLLTHNSSLSADEITCAVSVLGPQAIRYGDVRVAEGGILNPIFRLNHGRAFTTFHTVNLPGKDGAGRTLQGLLVHELVHVLQHERLGSVYIGQCLRAQRQEGYDYGGAEGLKEARSQGKDLTGFNREQQAQIAEDYFNRRALGLDVSAYEPYIRDLQQGIL